MDVQLIIGNIDERIKAREELAEKSLADDVSFLAEDEKTPTELLTECIYDDFVKAR
jgi:hypothetical protein